MHLKKSKTTNLTRDPTKLLDFIVRSDLAWTSNTEYIVERANKKLWCIKRLKNLDAETEDLLQYGNPA